MSIPAIRIQDCHITGPHQTSTFTKSEIDQKVQEIFNESIVQHLVSTVSSLGTKNFNYKLIDQNNIVIEGDKGNCSLTSYLQSITKTSPSQSSSQTIDACLKVQSMVQELLDSLTDTVAAPTSEHAGRIRQLELENADLKKQNARLEKWKATRKEHIEIYKANEISYETELKQFKKDTDPLIASVNTSLEIIQAKERENAELAAQLEAFESAVEAGIKAQDEELAALRLQNQAPARNAEADQKRIQELEAALAAKNAEVTKQVAAATKASHAAKTQISTLQQQVDSKNAAINRLERTLDIQTNGQ